MDNIIAGTDKVTQDLRAVVHDTEELLKATASQTGERVEKARSRAEETLRGARARLQEAGLAAGTKAKEAAQAVDETIHENPWTAIGVAAGLGVLLGVLLRRH